MQLKSVLCLITFCKVSCIYKYFIQHFSYAKKLNVINTDVYICACYRSPDSVMMCILPEDASNDVALHIHFTLIEAFCLENDIRVVKVQFCWKLWWLTFNSNYMYCHCCWQMAVFHQAFNVLFCIRAIFFSWPFGLFSLCLFCGQVDSVAKIAKLLKENATELEDNDFTRWQGADYNCLLIEVLRDIHYDKLQMYCFW